MNEQEKFDDLLRSKLSERDFPFDETNWDKAEAMIERSEKRKRFGFMTFIFSSGILVGLGIMYLFLYNNTSSTKQTTQLLQQNNVATAQNQNNNAAATSSTGLTQANGQTQVSNNSSTGAANNSQPIASSNNSSAQIANNNSNSTSTHNSASSVSANTTIANANTSVEKFTRSETTKHNKHKTKPDSTVQYSYVRPASEKTTNRKNNHTALASNNTQQSPTVTNSVSAYNTTSNTQANTQNPTSINSTTPQASSAPNNITSNNTTTPLAAKDSSVKKDSNTILAANTQAQAKKPDTTTTLTQQTAKQPPVKYSHTLFSIDAGGEYALGWMKAGGTQGNGISPVVGFSATHYFSTKLSVLLGLHYNSLGNINTLYSVNNSQYDFGAENNVTSVTVKTLYYLTVPLQVQYSINEKNIISAGINACYLINDNSDVVSYSQNYFGTSGYTSTTKMGYTDGINPWDAQLMLAYRRKINRFTISAEGYYGLMDIENNSFFNNTVFERNSGLRLLLSYDIIK